MPELKEKGYINYDNRYVWLAFDGYTKVTDLIIAYIASKLSGYNEVDEPTLNRVLEATVLAKTDQEKGYWKETLKARGIIEEIGEGKWRVRH